MTSSHCLFLSHPNRSMILLNPHELIFPHPDTATREGVVAIGGDLSVERLLLAYQYGYFPWYNPDEPIIWWHPDPRFVLFTEDVRVTKSMRSYFSQEKFRLTFDQDFDGVINACECIKRKDQPGTWITESIKEAYGDLHRLGYAHSVEVWKGDLLVGGLYGVSIGKVFFGESMFSEVSNSSKFALISLARILRRHGYEIIDCQMPNQHLKSMGGRFIKRDQFLNILRSNFMQVTVLGNWEESMNIFPIPELINDL